MKFKKGEFMIKYQVGDMVYFRGSKCKILHVLSKGKCLIISLGFGLQTSVANSEVKPILKLGVVI